MRKLFLSVSFLLLLLTVNAQTANQATSSHYKAAEELLLAMNLKRASTEVAEKMLDIQLKSNPSIASKKDLLMKFFNKHLSWDALSKDYIAAYVEEFSEKDLKDLTAFYNSPIGKKLVAKQTSLGLKMGLVMQDRMKSYQADLLNMLRED